MKFGFVQVFLEVKGHLNLNFGISCELFCRMEKRGRSRTRTSDYSARGMSMSRAPSRSRSRSAAPVTVLYMPTQDETKYFDTSQSQAVSSAADWTGSEVPSTNYVQSDGTTVGAYTDAALIPSAIGAGYGQVNGSKYRIKKIRCRGIVTSTAASDNNDVGAPAGVRVVLVQDTRPNGAQAQGEEVFTDMGGASQCNFSYLAMGAGQAGRFRILKDQFVVLNPAVAATDGTNTNSFSRNGEMFSFTWKPKVPPEVLLKANSATPTVASLSSMNVFLLAHSDSAAITIQACSRTYYQG